MMLNAEQSVQGMIDEHRRKLQEAAPAPEPAEGPEGASPAPPAGIFQGARAAAGGAAKRRMGTMLGVAPQVGGVQPPNFHGGPTPPLPSAEAIPEPAAAESSPRALGGTIAFAPVPAPVAAPAEIAPPANPLAAGRTEAFPTPPVAPAPGSPLAAGRTEAFEAVSSAAPRLENPLAAGRTEAVAAVPEPAPSPPPALQRGRTEAFDATPPPIEQPSLHRAGDEARGSVESYAPAGVPRRLKPLDVFLIVISFGLYALVLRARQRKAAQRPTS
jgi:hypothetical protein